MFNLFRNQRRAALESLLEDEDTEHQAWVKRRQDFFAKQTALTFEEVQKLRAMTDEEFCVTYGAKLPSGVDADAYRAELERQMKGRTFALLLNMRKSP